MMIRETIVKPVFTDERGAITDIFSGEIHNIGTLTFTKGAVRGNHYHKRQTQHTYVLSGKAELHVRAADNPDAPVEMHILEVGSLSTIPPNVIHAYRALEPTHMICFTDLSRSGDGFEEDTYRVKIIE